MMMYNYRQIDTFLGAQLSNNSSTIQHLTTEGITAFWPIAVYIRPLWLVVLFLKKLQHTLFLRGIFLKQERQSPEVFTRWRRRQGIKWERGRDCTIDCCIK